MRPAGSKTRRTACMTSRSSGLKRSASFSALSRPTPCSPVTVPPSVDAGVEDLLVRLEGPRELARDPLVVADHRVEVPVPGVEHVGDDEPVAGGDRLDLRHDRRELRAGHHRVLQHVVVRDAAHRARRPPSAPSRGAPARRRPCATRIVSEPRSRQIRRHRLGLRPRPRRPGPSSSIRSTAFASVGIARRGRPPRPPG